MKSATAATYELDDISAAVTELAGQIREKLDLEKESIGILYGQPDMELGDLSAKLHEELGFSIIGGTTAGGATLSNDGHQELAVILHVLTAADCYFATAISPSIITDPAPYVIATYKNALSALHCNRQGEQPKLVFCITSIVQGYSSDSTLAPLHNITNGLPIFGFVAADDFEFSKEQVFLNGESGSNRVALLLISGNVRPIFEIRNLAGSQTLSKKQVTKASGTTIYEIDSKPAYEYIKEFPFIEKEAGSLWNYQFFVEMQNQSDNDGVLVSRVLSSYSKESGEVSCFANVPQHSYISLLYCDGTDVKSSCKKALEGVKAKIAEAQQDSYQYSTILITSCSLRNMFLADEKDAEGNLIKEIIPPGLATSGMYALGEIAPTSIRNGKAVNRFHNATITICAL